MNAKKCIVAVLFLLISVSTLAAKEGRLKAKSLNTLAAEEAQPEDRTFENCLLHEVEGRIWLQHQIVALGMVGVAGTPPFCLSEELAKQFAPLVSRIGPKNEQRQKGFYNFEMPTLAEEEGHFVLVSMKAQMRGIFTERPEDVDRTHHAPRPSYYEVVDARVLSAEFVSAKWVEGWRTVDEALKEIVSQSLAAPGEEKRNQLAEAIEKGSRALNSIAEMKASDDFRALLDKVDPNARVAETFKRQIIWQWQGWLEKFARRLGIEPKTPLPPRCSRRQVLELMLQSKSAAEFEAKLRQSCPGAEGFGGIQFKEIRDDANEILAQIRREEDGAVEDKGPEKVEQLGVVLRPASTELLARKLILSGVVVERVLQDGENMGLREGNIILNYDNHVYQVVMGWYGGSGQIRELANRARWQGELRVLRGDDIVTIGVKSGQ